MHHVGVLGLGYVGLPLAVGLNRAGNRVVGLDINQAVVDSLSSGMSVVDDVTDPEVRGYLDDGSTFTNDRTKLAQCSVFIICVPTPLDESGHPDLSYVKAAGESIGQVMKPDSLVILESSTHPGTTDGVLAPILEMASGLRAGESFCLAYSPERIDPGNPKFRLENTPKIVGGLDEESLDRAVELYASMGIEVVQAKGLREAETAKLLENTYRHINIALVNEMVKFCRPLGIDLWNAIDCAASKPFGFEAFYPGPGVGGHCIPIDPHYLSHQVRIQLGRPFRFVELAQEINASMPAYVVERVQDELNTRGKALRGSHVAILGVTYKPNVSDQRETPAIPIVKLLLERGAEIAYVDPHVPQWSIGGVEVTRWELSDLVRSDLVLLLQDHEEFLEPNSLGSEIPVLDTRAVLTGANVAYL